MLADSCILLRGLRFHAYHGVGAQEHVVGNDYEVSLRLKVSVEKAMTTDDVRFTVNYAEVYGLVAKVMAEPCKLVERVAYRIGEKIFETWPQVAEVTVSVVKLNPPMNADCKGAGVEIRLINDKTKDDS
jgi:dihydroneopterin aldolase